MQSIASAALDGALYSVPQVARILGVKHAKVRSWVEGYKHSGASPILGPTLDRLPKGPVLTFLDLIESAWVAHFLRLGYSPQTIRKVISKLRERTEFAHPFASKKRFLADGKAIFEETVDEDGERRLLNLMNDNFTMKNVVLPSLFEQIFYVDDVAAQFKPMVQTPNVIIQPKVAHGRPAVKGEWVPTETLYNAYVAENGDMEGVADEFRIDVGKVREAVDFERALRERTLH